MGLSRKVKGEGRHVWNVRQGLGSVSGYSRHDILEGYRGSVSHEAMCGELGFGSSGETLIIAADMCA